MKTLFNSKLLLCLILMLTIFSSALFAQRGLYFGGSVGPSFTNKSLLDVGWEDVGFDGNEMSYKVFAGYRLPAFLAIEAGYRDLGEINNNFLMHKSAGWDANLKGDISIGPLQIFGKVGAFFNDVKITFADPLHPDINETNTKLLLGLGAGLNLGKVGIRAEWESLDLTKGNNVSMLTAGLTFSLAGGN